MSGRTVKGYYILGVGHHTVVIIELLELLGLPILGLVHYAEGRTGERVCGHPIVGSNRDLFARDDLSDSAFALSMGDNAIRSALAQQIRDRGGRVPTLIGPHAVVSRYAELEEGVVVPSHATVMAGATIARDTVIAVNAAVSHHATIESGCWIAGNAFVGAYARVCRQAFIGVSATILSKPGIVIGERAVVGGGAVVTRSVAPGTTVVGNPARPIERTAG